MNRLYILILFQFVTALAHSQSLYIKTFGDKKAKPIIFLHGGPGYNCASFEATTAQKLADEGFFVIVYDRRGEGRSPDPKAAFTFQQTFDDLNKIYKKYKLKKASLIGHSFGGIIGILFAEKYPQKINTLALVGAPLNLQESFRTIILSSKLIYKEKNNSVQMGYISQVEMMDTASLEYSSSCFGYAMQNGFYSPKLLTEEVKGIYKEFKSNPLSKYASEMTYDGPKGFWKNEHYTTLNLTSNLENLVTQKVKVIGLYGWDDGLYSKKQVKAIENILDSGKLYYYENCSHSVFIDQQDGFLATLKKEL